MKLSLKHIHLVFIVSRGRSGSTLMQSILDAHPNICAPIESKFVLHLKTKYHDVSSWSEKIINSFIKDLYTNRKFRLFWDVTPNELHTLFDKYHVTSFSDACKIVYLSHHSMFEKTDIKLIVDKNPLHSRLTSELLTVFPDSKFIHLIRDPRAATYSHFKTLMQKNIPQLAFEWKLLNKKIEGIKRNHMSIFYTIKYEDLVNSAEAEFQKIFKFINLPYLPEILNANSTIKEKYSSNKYLSQSHHKNITAPITNSNINLWQSKLSSEEVEIINLICEKQLIQYKYTYDKAKQSFKQKVILIYGSFRANLKNKLIEIMFKAPFVFRVFLYQIVSYLIDKKFKN
jgi:hypothetical protein